MFTEERWRKPGQLVMQEPLARAANVCKVLGKTGENKAARAKATSSAGVAEPMVASAEWPVRMEMGGGVEEESVTIWCQGFGVR
jgi:hypothetical protein